MYNPDGVSDSWAMQSLANIADSISKGYPTDPFDYVRASWADFGPGAAQALGTKQIDFAQYMANLRNQQILESMRDEAALGQADIQGRYGLMGNQMRDDTERWKLPQELAGRENVATIGANAQGKMEMAKMAQLAKQFEAEQRRHGAESMSKRGDAMLPDLRAMGKSLYPGDKFDTLRKRNDFILGAYDSASKGLPVNYPERTTGGDSGWAQYLPYLKWLNPLGAAQGLGQIIGDAWGSM